MFQTVAGDLPDGTLHLLVVDTPVGQDADALALVLGNRPCLRIRCLMSQQVVAGLGLQQVETLPLELAEGSLLRSQET